MGLVLGSSEFLLMTEPTILTPRPPAPPQKMLLTSKNGQK